ncbi:decarboxylase [Bacteroidota bacterium]
MSLNWKILDELSSHYGESFYLLDSRKFEQNYDDFLDAFRKLYTNTFIGYSYKTNYIPKLCSIIDEKGGYAEVVSEMEYDLAIKIGVAPNKIIVNGPSKSKSSLSKYLLKGSLVNIDSLTETMIVEQIAKENPDNNLNVGLRCNFKIIEGFVSRFGFDVSNSSFMEVFKTLHKIKNIYINGLHCHFPNRDLESYHLRVDKMLKLVGALFIKPPGFISVGGGYFGKMEYSLKEQFGGNIPEYHEYANTIATKMAKHFDEIPEELKPKLFLEPGNAIVADTMKFVVQVTDIKTVRGSIIATTNGSRFNIGLLTSKINLPIKTYQSPFTKDKTNNKFSAINIAGYTCIEDDYLYKNYIGNLYIGDYVVFDNVGSYSFNFKPPFILPNVAIINYDFENGCFEIVKRSETMEDVFSTFIL